MIMWRKRRSRIDLPINQELTEEQRQNHLDTFVKNPKRIEEVWNMLNKLIVGEKENKRVLFYNFISSFLDHPNGTLVLGEASGGKTHMVREVLKLFPDEMKIIVGGMSKKALIHRKPDNITPQREREIFLYNKILWFLESKGSEESYDILRPILSRDQKEIRYELPTKKKSKEPGHEGEYFENEVIIIKGCPSFVTTSTKIEVLPETGTRVFTLMMDESREQNARVLNFKSHKKQFLINDPDFKPIQHYIENLKQYKIWIPFADIINISSEHLNVRRDIDKIYALIEAHVLFNQVDRQTVVINGEEYLPAYLEDYFYILDIILPIINPTLVNIPKKILDFYEVIRKKVKCGDLPRLTHKDISLKTHYNQGTTKAYCWQLVESGKLVKEKEGNVNIYYLRESDENDVSVTIVTRERVTPSMIHTSLESAISTMLTTVTQNERGPPNLYDFLSKVYSFSVTLVTDAYFTNTSLIDLIDTVIKKSYTTVTNGYTPKAHCISCDGRSPPFILIKGKCEICRGSE